MLIKDLYFYKKGEQIICSTDLPHGIEPFYVGKRMIAENPCKVNPDGEVVQAGNVLWHDPSGNEAGFVLDFKQDEDMSGYSELFYEVGRSVMLVIHD